jgi:hypothetical protein
MRCRRRDAVDNSDVADMREVDESGVGVRFSNRMRVLSPFYVRFVALFNDLVPRLGSTAY